ncbi:MAG TPA: ATP-binding protein, partial [Polyangiaceae bacterium]|nr:ATP-binding protein [Polyangiaceae bacterium]
TFARLARAALGGPFVEALREAIPGGRAERLGLVERAEPAPGRPLSQQPLRLSAAELAAALGGEPAAEPGTLSLLWEPPAGGAAFDPEFVAGAAGLLRERGLLCVRTSSPRAGRQLGLDLASHRGEPALFVTAGDEAPDPAEIGRLRGGLVVVDLTAAAGPRGFSEAFAQRLARHQRPLVVIAPWSASTFEIATVDVERLGPKARRRVWELGLGDGAPAARLAARFGVGLEEVRAAARAARDAALVRGRGEGAADEGAVAAEIMAQGARHMGRLVTRLRTDARLDDLVVPPALRRTLDDILDWYRASPRVRGEWRMGERSPLGLGLACLFAGPSGTGKTFAAQCIAGALGLNLYRIDLSQVVSKYIGETEKALHQVFEEAEAGHGVLLFDEADALFGKRSEVKDAHDRYANIEVGYLLQRLESYDGIAVLTTNLQGNMDAAFVRRLRFILHFPAPDRELRRRLWERSLPGPDWRAADLELDALADRFQLTGGAIHNIGLAAAHLAAATPEGRVTTAHVVRATQRELQKTGRPADPRMFGALVNGASA